jgi:hypothetical protein
MILLPLADLTKASANRQLTSEILISAFCVGRESPPVADQPSEDR